MQVTYLYFLQDDIVMGTLTVRENLAFSAALRLPNNLSSQERRDKVDDVIRELGLTLCADSKVNMPSRNMIFTFHNEYCPILVHIKTPGSSEEPKLLWTMIEQSFMYHPLLLMFYLLF